MTTEQELEWANKAYPNDKAYKICAGSNLSMPQFMSGNRQNMFTSHLEQCLNIINPESPALSTSFEKPYGKYTDSYSVAQADFRVIDVIPKFVGIKRFNYVYILQNLITKVYDIVEVKHYETLSEDNGYLRPYTEGDTYNTGDIIRKGATFYKGTSHDEFGNYRYGRNAKVAYISLPENEEDGIVIRKGYCDAFAFYEIKQIPCTLNKNQILLNYYGDDKSGYKCFPDIGEEVKDNIIYVKRSINYQNAAAELTNNALKHPVSNDEVCKGEGVVGDIDIWVNDREEFVDSENKRQIYNYYQQLLQYYTKIFNRLDNIVNARQNSGVQYTYRLRWLYEHARNYLDQNVQWQNNNNSFEFAYIVLTTYERKTVTDGYKLTNRYGGKGVISHVWPDEYMPVDEYGNRADLIISPPGIIARANPGQSYEQEYNFIGEEIRKRIQKLPTQEQQIQLLTEFISDVNPKEGQRLIELLSKKNVQQRQAFLDDLHKNGMIIIHEPFGGTIKLDNLEFLYKKYKIVPGYVTICREFKDTTTALPLENQKHSQVFEASGYEFAKPSTSFDVNKRELSSNGIGSEGATPFDIDSKEEYTKTHEAIAPVGDGTYETLAPKQEGMQMVKAWINSEGLLVRQYRSLNRIVIGSIYYMLLKQKPDEKFSARSMGSTNQIGVPNKPGKQSKLMSPYARSAIRIGEMENDINFVRVPNEIVHRYMATHSQNPELREKLGAMLLTEDPFEMHDLPIKDEDIKDDVTALMFHSAMYSIGIEISEKTE